MHTFGLNFKNMKKLSINISISNESEIKPQEVLIFI